jgi:soluble lytic murein transglycosylase-like protein
MSGLQEWILKLPWEIIRDKAVVYGLDPLLVAAIILKEISGNPCAMRYEPNFQYIHNAKHYAELIESTYETEVRAQSTSWGFMQVMGAVAREHDHNGWLSELCIPRIGIEYGCRHLKTMFNRHNHLDSAIAAYNAGSPRFLENGNYVNQKYVDKVLKTYNQLKEIK